MLSDLAPHMRVMLFAPPAVVTNPTFVGIWPNTSYWTLVVVLWWPLSKWFHSDEQNAEPFQNIHKRIKKLLKNANSCIPDRLNSFFALPLGSHFWFFSRSAAGHYRFGCQTKYESSNCFHLMTNLSHYTDKWRRRVNNRGLAKVCVHFLLQLAKAGDPYN